MGMTDDALAELKFVSFKLHDEHFMFTVAGAVRRNATVHDEHGPQKVVDLYFVSSHLAKMSIGRDIEVLHPNGTSEVVDFGASVAQRRLQASSTPRAHIGSEPNAGIIG